MVRSCLVAKLSKPDEQSRFPGMGMPRRVSVEGREGTAATVAITTYRGRVWMSIMPPFTWEAILDPGVVDELIQALESARDEVKRIVAVAGLTSDPSRKAISTPR
jgi:hypothetical protein